MFFNILCPDMFYTWYRFHKRRRFLINTFQSHTSYLNSSKDFVSWTIKLSSPIVSCRSQGSLKGFEWRCWENFERWWNNIFYSELSSRKLKNKLFRDEITVKKFFFTQKISKQLHSPNQESETSGPRAGYGSLSKIIRPADPLQIIVIVWPA